MAVAVVSLSALAFVVVDRLDRPEAASGHFCAGVGLISDTDGSTPQWAVQRWVEEGPPTVKTEGGGHRVHPLDWDVAEEQELDARQVLWEASFNGRSTDGEVRHLGFSSVSVTQGRDGRWTMAGGCVASSGPTASQQRAVANALASFHPPARWSEIGSPPVDALRTPAMSPSRRDLAERTRFWFTSENRALVARWVTDHPPKGWKVKATADSATVHGVRLERRDGDHDSGPSLVVSIATMADGRSGVRVDAQQSRSTTHF